MGLTIMLRSLLTSSNTRSLQTLLGPRLMSSDASSGSGTIFDKILDGSIPAEFLHKDDQCVAFKDVSPQAPVHFLVIPRRRISMIQDVTASDRELVGHLMVTAANVAREQGLEDGYRIVVNNGE